MNVLRDPSEMPTLFDFIDPLIGSGGAGFGAGGINPGAQVPFGSLRLGPDTAFGKNGIVIGFEHFGGYSYADDRLRSFSHTHLVGAAVGGPVSPTRSGVANMENDGEQR